MIGEVFADDNIAYKTLAVNITNSSNGWPLDSEDTRLLGKLALPVCRHLLRHSCIVFTQHPQSQLVVYTVIIAE